MNEVEIKQVDFSHIIKKKDVWLVFTKSNKCWVCEIGGITDNDDMIVLKLATKGKSGTND